MSRLFAYSPECVEGRHDVCDGTGWFEMHQQVVDCGCDCHLEVAA